MWRLADVMWIFVQGKKIYNRIINYGCSHAIGAEIEGRGIYYHPNNTKYCYGNLIAKHFDLPFFIAARGGNSNKDIYDDVIHYAQSNDIALVGLTSSRLSIYSEPNMNKGFTLAPAISKVMDDIVNCNTSEILLKIYGEETYKKKLQKHSDLFGFTPNQTSILLNYYFQFYSNPIFQYREFLDSYLMIKTYFDSVGCKYIMWLQDCKKNLAQLLNEKTTFSFYKEEKYTNDINGQEFLAIPKDKIHPALKILTNDPNFLKLGNKITSMFEVIRNNLNLKVGEFNNERECHWGKEEHRFIADILIPYVEKTLDQS